MRNDEMYLQLYIIRHAESMGNIETQQEVDRLNPALTPHGKKQAEALGERFKGLDNFTLYASPLDRAKETAGCISSDMIIDYDLLENCTRFNGESFEEFDETDDECMQRAKRVIEKIKEKHQNHENVIIVAHGVFNQFLLKAALDLPNVFRFAIYNTAVSKVNFCHTEQTKLALQNDIAHLKDIDGEKLFWM